MRKGQEGYLPSAFAQELSSKFLDELGRSELRSFCKKERFERGVSQEELADALELASQQHISNFERGVSFSLPLVWAYVVFLGIPPPRFFEEVLKVTKGWLKRESQLALKVPKAHTFPIQPSNPSKVWRATKGNIE